MLKKYLFIGLVISSLNQESFASSLTINPNIRTPAPHDVLDEFRATGSDPEHRENELARLESLRLVSGRGRRFRAGPALAPELSAINLLQRLQPLEETPIIPRANLDVVFGQTVQALGHLAQVTDIQGIERQSPQPLLDIPDFNEDVNQAAPNSPVMQAEREIDDILLEAELHDGRDNIEVQVIIPEPVVVEARLAQLQEANHNPVSAYDYSSLYSQDNLSDRVDASNHSESNQTTNLKKETEIKHARIQSAQPLDLHNLTAHLTHSTAFRMATPMAGVAAGSEELITYGFWSSGFGTFGKQRDALDEKRFKLIQKGIVLGADSLVNESILLGIAYSNSAIVRTYDTEDLMSNKQKIMSHIFSLYGSYKFDNPFYVSAQAQYAKIHLKARRHSNIDTSIFVSGETKGQMYGCKIEAGYNFNNIDGLYFIPKLGISYNSSKLREFNEAGTGVAFTFHDSMKSNRLATSAGFEIRKKIATKYHVIVPSLYFAVEKILVQKNGNVRISNEELSLNQINLVTKSPKDKGAFMLGGKISAYHNRGYEIDLGYDLLVQSKFLSHTGSVKFKINF